MLKSKAMGRKPILLASVVLCTILIATIWTAEAGETGCVTCHLDKEMLIKTVKVKEGKKSAMQSGAG
jgi:hypothetical protein